MLALTLGRVILNSNNPSLFTLKDPTPSVNPINQNLKLLFNINVSRVVSEEPSPAAMFPADCPWFWIFPSKKSLLSGPKFI